jgi:hypothetical protein
MFSAAFFVQNGAMTQAAKQVPIVEKGQKTGHSKARKQAKRYDPVKTVAREQKLTREPSETHEATKGQKQKKGTVSDGKSTRVLS